MAFLSMTRLKIKSILLLPKFIIQNEAIVKQIRTSKGLKIGKSLLDPSLGAWTVSIWDSEESMRAFYTSGAHRNIMPSLSYYSSEAVTAHISFDEENLPSWDFVHEQLSKIGRFSTVLKDPSKNHLSKIIPKPKTTLLTRPINPQA